MAKTGDIQDWNDADPADAFNAVSSSIGSSMSAVDFTVMQAIGYTPVAAVIVSPPTLNISASGNTVTLS